ncbi:hypothetical protein, partial [Paenisporosarcina sp. TG20]|uniref:hypothetical protein n=1 Tax=Paenisporosarcina sp. TG20 TaxID=1211706 RepID=UPI001ED94D7A
SIVLLRLLVAPALQLTSVYLSIIATNSIFSDNHLHRERYKGSRNTSSTLFAQNTRISVFIMQTTALFHYLKYQ